MINQLVIYTYSHTSIIKMNHSITLKRIKRKKKQRMISLSYNHKQNEIIDSNDKNQCHITTGNVRTSTV